METDKDTLTKEYELAYFVATPEADAELLAALKKCGIEVTSKTELAPRTLAYPIQKQTSALFGCARLVAAPEAIAELQTNVRHLSGLLRHLLVHLPARPAPIPTRASGSASVGASGPAPTGASTPASVEASGPPKIEIGAVLSNEALEEKLKEML